MSGRLKQSSIPVVQVSLIALFITALVTAQLVSSKLIAVSLPLVGAVAMPGGTLAYAATFFATDTISELYGKSYARKVVNVGFFMNFVMLALVWLTAVSPAAPHSIDASMFSDVMLAGTNIVFGSLGAYIISQNFDVTAFHFIRDRTGKSKLWLRNIASTGVSQFIDTAIFTVIAFWVAPQLFGIGHALPTAAIVATIIGQYFGKLLIAIADTPFVYAVVGWVEKNDNIDKVVTE